MKARHHRLGGVKSGVGIVPAIEKVVFWTSAFVVGIAGGLLLQHAIHLLMGEVWL